MLRRSMLVASREFSVTVRRKAYILTVFGAPLLFGGLIFVSGYFAAKSAVTESVSAVAVVDSSGVLDPAMIAQMEQGNGTGVAMVDDAMEKLINSRLETIPASVKQSALASFTGLRGAAIFLMDDANEAREVARRGDLDGALIIAGDYLESGRVWGYGKSRNMFNDEGDSQSERILRRALMLSMAQREGVSEQVSARLLAPMNLRTFELKEQGEGAGQFEEAGAGSEIRKFALPYAFSLLLMMSIFMSGGFLLQGVAEEKENRVIELLLSSVTPDELMFGKVLGLGGAGLLQMLIWLGLAFGVLTFASVQWMPDFDIPVLLFVQAFVYFILGYLMIASLMAGAGSLGNTQKESQQLSAWFTMPVVIPMALMMAILAQPNGTLARVLSYIPITSPVTMMMRLPSEQIAWWEFPATVVLLLGATWFSLWLGAKLFRMGSLMYGKRPTLPEIFRGLREA